MVKSKKWKKMVGYQVFPATFLDTNGDGFGDINGITKKVPYLRQLGIDFIYINPVYLTDFDDSGYDVNNYKDIDPRFGTMKDIEHLISVLEENNMFLMMDLVMNHVSINNIWFKEAKKSRDSKYHDFFIWTENPNHENISIFGGSAWEYNEETREYYLHTFAKSQPDLNWENEEMREEFVDMVNFWINKGIKGFRLDAIQFIGKDVESWKIVNGPKMNECLKYVYDNSYGMHNDIFTMGESYDVTKELVYDLSSDSSPKKALDAYMNFGAMGKDWGGEYEKYTPNKKKILGKTVGAIFKWQAIDTLTVNNNSNHDQPRISDRYFGKEYIVEQQKLFNALLFSIKGIPLLYYGEEIGMPNSTFKTLEEFNDTTIKSFMENTDISDSDMLEGAKTGSRDLARSAMSWNEKNYGGFTTLNKSMWKPGENYEKINVEKSSLIKDGVYQHLIKLINLRKKSKYSDVLTSGVFKQDMNETDSVLEWSLTHGNITLKVFANISDQSLIFTIDSKDKEIIYNTHNTLNKNSLSPFQLIIIK